MFIKSVKLHVIGWKGCESRRCSVVFLGSAAGNSCQKFQNQSVFPTWSNGCTGRAELENVLRFLGVFSNFSSGQEKLRSFPGAPSEVVINDVPAWKHQGDAVDIPPALGRACFREKQSRKRTKVKNHNIYERPDFHKLRGKISWFVLNWKITPHLLLAEVMRVERDLDVSA